MPSHFDIALGGQPATAALMHDLEQVVVERCLHLPDVATLTLHDPRLTWVDSSQLAPGTPLRISVRSTRETVLFDGELVEIEPEFERGTQRLTVRAFNRLHRLAHGRRVRPFVNVTDDDVMRQLAGEVGLDADIVSTGEVYPYLLQANETNLAFLQRRAAAIGAFLYVTGTTLHCQVPPINHETLEVTWGETLYDFRPRLTTMGQARDTYARGWDPNSKRPLLGKAGRGMLIPQIGPETPGGRRSGGDVAAQAFDLDDPQLQFLTADRPLRTQRAADLLAQAVAEQRAGRFIEAEGTCAGLPSLVAGVSLSVRAVGDRFGGTYFVTGTTHRATRDDDYQTSFTVSGLSPAMLLGLLTPQTEGVSHASLVIGVVTDNNDPLGQGRVRVSFPWLSPDHSSDWARVVTLGGGARRGIQFLPEVDDEVLVGLEMDDINYPYVLGGLWNGVDAPPRANDQLLAANQVRQRVIRSRTGHEIRIDDQEGGGGITIEDRQGNRIALDTRSNGLTIQAKGPLSLVTEGDLSLEAGGELHIRGINIAVEGGASVTVTAPMIDLN
jgi:phage protein D